MKADYEIRLYCDGKGYYHVLCRGKDVMFAECPQAVHYIEELQEQLRKEIENNG